MSYADEPRTLASLSSELIAEIIQRLPSARDVCAARSCAVLTRDVCREHEESILAAIFALPRVRPYSEFIGYPTGGTGR